MLHTYHPSATQRDLGDGLAPSSNPAYAVRGGIFRPYWRRMNWH